MGFGFGTEFAALLPFADDADGQPLLIATSLFDATDRRAYERELLIARRQAEDLPAFVDAANFRALAPADA